MYVDKKLEKPIFGIILFSTYGTKEKIKNDQLNRHNSTFFVTCTITSKKSTPYYGQETDKYSFSLGKKVKKKYVHVAGLKKFSRAYVHIFFRIKLVLRT